MKNKLQKPTLRERLRCHGGDRYEAKENTLFFEDFQSVSAFPRLCLQTPGTSCRLSRRPAQWLELSLQPAEQTSGHTSPIHPLQFHC